jgi:hypothetical protein
VLRRTIPILLLVVALASGCQWVGHARGDRVSFHGDSIGARARVQITNQLTPAYRLFFSARERAVIADELPTIRAMAAGAHGPVPQIAVVELGTGDANFGFGDGRMRRNIRQVLDALRGVPCVRWLSLKVGGVNGIYEGYIRRADDFNRILHAQVRDYPNARVAPYREWARTHAGSFLADGLHHNGPGRGRYAAFVKQAAQGCP